MNSKSVISGLMAVCMIASAPAFAQRSDYGNDRNEQAQRGNDNARYDRDNRNDRDARVNRNDRDYRNDRDNRNDRAGRNDRNDYSPAYANNNSRGAGPRHDMRRGARISSEYRNRQYVVSDWRGHHLSAPPRGQQWVQAGSDYVLVGIATGIIAQVLLSN
jgi:Ni/Co efflux regulator RcnB